MADWKKLAKTPEEWGKLNYNDPRLDTFTSEVEKRYELPTGMLEALKNAGERTPPAESGKAVSSAGAKGIMQFTDNTRKLQQGMFDHDVNNPFASIDAAGKYMQFVLKNQYPGKPLAAIADYNGGPAQAKAVLAGKEPPAQETKDYLVRVKDYLNRKYGK